VERNTEAGADLYKFRLIYLPIEAFLTFLFQEGDEYIR
jgi:hypothetical protein